jgi:hypothetical protein
VDVTGSLRGEQGRGQERYKFGNAKGQVP